MTDKSDEKIATKRSWLERLSTMLAREPQNREQLMEILRDAESRDVLGAEMLGMIERILSVSEMQVRDVMVPKANMILVDKESTLPELLSTVSDSGHSRFPVIDSVDGSIIGILLAKDILKYFNDHTQFDIKKILRPAVFTSQSKRLDILLREFRENRNHLDIVLDEYGHVAGLVTIEDVLEQIVGDIEDEYDIDEDTDEASIKKHDEHTYIVKAPTQIAEFNEYFHTNFSEEDFDTIGGIVLQHFGHLPKRGENIKLGNLRFKVLNSDNRRIYLLEVKVGKKKV